MYHHVVASDQADERLYEVSIHQFERQLDWLKSWKFKTISFNELLRGLTEDSELPRHSVIITFDDAFRSFLELALPSLRRRSMRATMFVPAGHIGGTNVWDEDRGFSQRRITTADELRQIAAAGTEIGSHGWLHRDLTLCSESEVDEELVRSKAELERVVERPVRVFSYPYGHYRSEHFSRLRAARYEAAVSIFSNEPTVTSNRFAMRRVYIHPGDGALRFKVKLSAAYLRFLAWRGAVLQPRQDLGRRLTTRDRA